MRLMPQYRFMPNRLQLYLQRLGFEFRATPARAALFSEQAVDQVLSILTNAADPDEVLAKAGVSRARLRVLSGDDEISAAMDTRREALLALPWRLEVPGRDDGKYPEPVQWLWDQFDPHAEKVLRACMEALPYGYSVQEAVYTDADKGRLTWAEITEKPFEWFIPKLDGNVLYRSRNQPMGEAVDARKFFLTARNQTYRQPYGEALYSRLYWPWYFRQQGWRFWVRWLERFGTPLLVGQTQGDAKTMAEQLAAVANNAVIAVGGQDTVTIAENKGGAGHFEAFERAVCARIQKLILGQTLTSDSGGSSGRSGSYALGQIHNEVRTDRRNADIRMVRKTVQRMIDVLWALNGFAGDPPDFIMADDTGLELDRAERDARLVQAGVVKLTPDYLLRVYDYEPDDLDVEAMQQRDLVAEHIVQRQALKNPPPAKASVLFAAPPRFTPDQQAIEDEADDILDRLGDAIGDAEIKAAIRASSSRDELVEHLTALLPNVPAATFRAVLERALFAADVMGFVHASNR
ncbi:MAG: DUF935 family protein [Burkholderiales bacterium]|nr:DUF935 family protein [Burkholderiales bacterium]